MNANIALAIQSETSEMQHNIRRQMPSHFNEETSETVLQTTKFIDVT